MGYRLSAAVAAHDWELAILDAASDLLASFEAREDARAAKGDSTLVERAADLIEVMAEEDRKRGVSSRTIKEVAQAIWTKFEEIR